MKSDLRNLITAQEAYFSDNNRVFAPSVDAMGTNYRATNGVTVSIFSVTATGWSATATDQITAVSCRISVGGGSKTEGVPICK